MNPEAKVILRNISELVKSGITERDVKSILELISVSTPGWMVDDLRLYSDVLPVGALINPYSQEQRYLHFLWDSFFPRQGFYFIHLPHLFPSVESIMGFIIQAMLLLGRC